MRRAGVLFCKQPLTALNVTAVRLTPSPASRRIDNPYEPTVAMYGKILRKDVFLLFRRLWCGFERSEMEGPWTRRINHTSAALLLLLLLLPSNSLLAKSSDEIVHSQEATTNEVGGLGGQMHGARHAG